MHQPFEPPSASTGVEGSGAVSGSGEEVKRVKKESIDVFREVGGCVSGELLCSSSFDWGLLDEMWYVSLSFMHFLAAAGGHKNGVHKPLRKGTQ
jgi:hypothetical protein